MIRSALVALERFLLPNACVVCDQSVEQRTPDDLVCAVCRSRLRIVPAGCPRCRQPMPPVGPCRFCADFPRALCRVTSAVWLGPEARAIAHHLKYQGYSKLAELAARAIARAGRPASPVCLIPVPLSTRRRRTRGYNQATEIARALAQLWRVPVRADVLRRVRHTRSQTGLTPEQRVANVTGAFAVNPDRPPLEGTGRVILVDDVLTTGATVAAAAAALERAGREEIGGVTFARALPYELRALADGNGRATRATYNRSSFFTRHV